MDADPFEIILLDLQLPLMGGMDLFSHVRKQWPTTQVIIMTGFVISNRLGRQSAWMSSTSSPSRFISVMWRSHGSGSQTGCRKMLWWMIGLKRRQLIQRHWPRRAAAILAALARHAVIAPARAEWGSAAQAALLLNEKRGGE